MSVHPLVAQLYFTRSEFMRAIEGVTAEEAEVRFKPMNSISWMVGHLADQEARFWVLLPGGQPPHPELRDLVGTGKPASTPPLGEMLEAWRHTTKAANSFLEGLTLESSQRAFTWRGRELKENVGTLLFRSLFHYWFHTGEILAVRQQLGHQDLPEFVGPLPAFDPKQWQ